MKVIMMSNNNDMA